MARYVGKRIVPKHCGYWDNTKPYEMENIVYDRTSGNSYISRKAVPVGTDISQEEYWALCSDFNMLLSGKLDDAPFVSLFGDEPHWKGGPSAHCLI